MEKSKPTRKRRRWLAKLGLAAISTLVALLAAEVVLRIVAKEPGGVAQHHKLFCEHDPLLGWRKIADHQGRHVTSEYDVVERMNSRGLRGPEYPYEKPPGQFRILVLGDSFAEGYTVAFEQVLSEVLERRLTELTGASVEVINAGTGGYATDQALLFFENEGRKYQPDLTVLLFCHNDVWYNNQPRYRRGQKPKFELVDGELELTNVPVPEPESQPKVAKEAKPESAFVRLKGWFNRHSHLYRRIRGAIESSEALERVAKKAGLAEHQEGQTKASALGKGEWAVFKTDAGDTARQAWRVTDALLALLKKQTAENGGGFVVLDIPPMLAIYEEQRNAFLRQPGIDPDTWDFTLVSRELKTTCQRLDIDLITSMERFREQARQLPADQRLYFELDGHWTEQGHRLAGELLAEEIQARWQE